MPIPALAIATSILLLAWIGVMLDPEAKYSKFGKIFRRIGLPIVCVSILFISLSSFVPYHQTPTIKTFIVPLEDKGDRQVFKVPAEALGFFVVRATENVSDIVCSFTKQMGCRTDKKYVKLIIYSNTAYGIDWPHVMTTQACDGPEEKSEK